MKWRNTPASPAGPRAQRPLPNFSPPPSRRWRHVSIVPALAPVMRTPVYARSVERRELQVRTFSLADFFARAWRPDPCVSAESLQDRRHRK